jgi:hypothetical protein
MADRTPTNGSAETSVSSVEPLAERHQDDRVAALAAMLRRSDMMVLRHVHPAAADFMRKAETGEGETEPFEELAAVLYQSRLLVVDYVEKRYGRK